MARRVIIVAVVVLFTTAHLSCGPPIYFAEPIHGVVLDAANDQPLPGTVVVAEWVLFQPMIGHGAHGARLYLAEAVANDQGAYHIDGWGPKLRPVYGFLTDYAPRMTFFKAGYEPLVVHNAKGSNAMTRVSDWDGRRISLGSYHGDQRTRADQLGAIVSRVLEPDTVDSLSSLIAELEKEKPVLGTIADGSVFGPIDSLKKER